LNAKLVSAEQKLAESQAKLLEAENSELRVRKQGEGLERAKRDLELTITRRVHEQNEKFRQQADMELAERDHHALRRHAIALLPTALASPS